MMHRLWCIANGHAYAIKLAPFIMNCWSGCRLQFVCKSTWALTSSRSEIGRYVWNLLLTMQLFISWPLPVQLASALLRSAAAILVFLAAYGVRRWRGGKALIKHQVVDTFWVCLCLRTRFYLMLYAWERVGTDLSVRTQLATIADTLNHNAYANRIARRGRRTYSHSIIFCRLMHTSSILRVC